MTEEEEILKEGGVEMPLTEVPEMMPEEEAPGFIYAIGRIQPRFPTLSVEKEFAQAAPEGKAANLTDPQVLYEILSQEENRYLAREVCWIFTVESIDTYLLQPRQYRELTQLVEAIKPAKGIDVDVVIGIRGPTAPPEMCNGLQVPIVTCNRIYSFDIEEFINVIPKPKEMEEEPFKDAARELFFRIMQLTDNVGAADEQRALNYVAVRYSAIYAHAMEMFVADKFLSSVEVRLSRLSETQTRRIVDVIFSYINSKTNVIEKYFTRVDVTEQWPFLVSKLQPFYER
jgi:FtsZ-interacting cell division protein YlmF